MYLSMPLFLGRKGGLISWSHMIPAIFLDGQLLVVLAKFVAPTILKTFHKSFAFRIHRMGFLSNGCYYFVSLQISQSRGYINDFCFNDLLKLVSFLEHVVDLVSNSLVVFVLYYSPQRPIPII